MRPLTLLVLTVLAAPTPAADPAARRVALLVGIDRYDAAGLPALKYAGRDAVELGRALVGQGFTTRVMTSADRDARPTKAAVEAAVRDACRGLTKRDVLVLFFTGHGVQVGTGETAGPYLVPCDGRPADPATLVAVSGVLDLLQDRGAGTNLILLDVSRHDPDPGRGAAPGFDRAGVGPGAAVLLSCSPGGRSYESDKLRHGLFTRAVLDGLGGQARDRSGEVTWDGLAAFVRADLPRRCAALNGKDRPAQHPHLIANLSGPPVVLVPAP